MEHLVAIKLENPEVQATGMLGKGARSLMRVVGSGPVAARKLIKRPLGGTSSGKKERVRVYRQTCLNGAACGRMDHVGSIILQAADVCQQGEESLLGKGLTAACV